MISKQKFFSYIRIIGAVVACLIAYYFDTISLFCNNAPVLRTFYGLCFYILCMACWNLHNAYQSASDAREYDQRQLDDAWSENTKLRDEIKTLKAQIRNKKAV